MKISSALTAFQDRSAKLANVDLSTGYPALLQKNEQWAAFIRLLSENSNGSPSSHVHEAELLSSAVARILRVAHKWKFIPTFSGSVAISRTLKAIASPGKNIVTTVPAFDSIATFAWEATGVEPILIERDAFKSNQDWLHYFLEAINPEIAAAMLVSPDNPTGSVLTKEQLVTIAERCGDCGTVLVVDQCFSLVNPNYLEIPLVVEVDGLTDWCLLWDSSKTVELSGEKVGFVLPCANLRPAIKSALDVIHLELPAPTIVSIRRALEHMDSEGRFSDLSNVVRENFDLISKSAKLLGINTNAPDAGSFIMIGMKGTPYAYRSVDLAEDLLMDAKIAVAPSALFYPAPTDSAGFVRVSLARPKGEIEYFCRTLESLLFRESEGDSGNR